MTNSDYRTFIIQHLKNKQKVNHRYSLRALSRDLDVSPSTLSEILNRHHTLSLKSSERILNRLKLDKKDEIVFRQSVANELFRKKSTGFVDTNARLNFFVREEDIDTVRLEIFEFFSKLNYYHHPDGVEFYLYQEVVDSLGKIFSSNK